MKQKQSKAAKERAIGLIGPGAVSKLEAANLVIIDRATLEKLHAALKDMEKPRHANLPTV